MIREIFCGKSSVENHLKIRCGFITMLVAVALNVATVYAVGEIEWEREEMYGEGSRGKCHVVLAKRARMKYRFTSDGPSGTASLCVNGKEVCESVDWFHGVNVNESVVLDPGAYDIAYDFSFGWWEDFGDSSGSCDVDIVDFSDKEPYQHGVKIISSKIRDNDPTVMDVTYVVYSDKPTVKVRALAFEDGERSFGKVVRPETFIDGTASNIGDAITPNVEHKLSWRVSSDWSAKLAKVKFEVLACVGDVLPLELMTIPATEQYEVYGEKISVGEMRVSWNKISWDQLFDALLWCYADKYEKLEIKNGEAFDAETGEMLYAWYARPLWEFLYKKMGYEILQGGWIADYVNEATRLNLGYPQNGGPYYAYKIVDK